MNQISYKDFGWYKSAPDAKLQNKTVLPTQHGVVRNAEVTNIQSPAYKNAIESSIQHAKHVGPIVPTVINIESKTYSAPIKVISVSHGSSQPHLRSAPVARPLHLSQPSQPNVHYNPLYEPRLTTNIQPEYTELPPNESSRSSIGEESEPLLIHVDTDASTNDYRIANLPQSDTTASDLTEGSGLSDESSNNQLDGTSSYSSNPTLDSSLKLMKRNSAKLDSLNFLDSDIESGAMFDNNVADLVNLDYKGDDKGASASDSSNDFNQYDSWSDFDERMKDSDKWNLYYSKRSPAWIIDLEEKERFERTARGMDATLLGKWHRVQREFMSSPRLAALAPSKLSEIANYLTEKISDTIAPVSEVLTEAPEAIFDAPVAVVKEPETIFEETAPVHHDSTLAETFSESGHLLTSGISGMFHSVAETAQGLLGSAKSTLGIYPTGSIQSINALEEKERAYRINHQVDPVLDAKKRHVERELMTSVKPAC